MLACDLIMMFLKRSTKLLEQNIEIYGILFVVDIRDLSFQLAMKFYKNKGVTMVMDTYPVSVSIATTGTCSLFMLSFPASCAILEINPALVCSPTPFA